jgi:hypothetical protein
MAISDIAGETRVSRENHRPATQVTAKYKVVRRRSSYGHESRSQLVIDIDCISIDVAPFFVYLHTLF